MLPAASSATIARVVMVTVKLVLPDALVPSWNTNLMDPEVMVYCAEPQSRTSPVTFSTECWAGLLADAAGVQSAHIAAADAVLSSLVPLVSSCCPLRSRCAPSTDGGNSPLKHSARGRAMAQVGGLTGGRCRDAGLIEPRHSTVCSAGDLGVRRRRTGWSRA